MYSEDERIAEAQKRMADAATESFRLIREKADREQVERLSSREVDRFLKARIEDGDDLGYYDPRIVDKYLERSANADRDYLVLVQKLLTHPLNKVTMTSEGFRFAGQDYKGLDSLQYAVAEQLGSRLSSTTWFRRVLTEVLKGTDPDFVADRVLAVERPRETYDKTKLTDNDRWLIASLEGTLL